MKGVTTMTAGAAVAQGPVRSQRASAGRITAVVVAYLALIVAGTLIPLAGLSSEVQPAPFITPVRQVALFLQYLLWLVPLLVAMERDPSGRFWKLVFAYVASAQVYVLAFTGIPLLWTIAGLLENVAVGVLLHLLLAFPSGYLRDRFDRAVIGAVYGYIVVVGALDLASRDPDPLDLLAPVPPATWLVPIVRAAVWMVPILALLVEVAIWRHWRAASPAARRGLQPIVIALTLFVAAVTVNVLAQGQGVEPVTEFFAYGGLVAAGFIVPLALTYGVIRARLGRGRVAGLIVELGRGVPVGGLRDLLARALDDPTLELAFAAPSGDGFVDADGRSIDLPGPADRRTVTRIERDGELLGLLIHDPAVDAEDPGLVEAVGNAAALALENERLAAQVRAQLEEVRASRGRLVDAADAERRRVERDLHDGAQQRLVALALRLQLAKATTAGGDELLDEATAELETAIGEVRDLARGLHPTLLTEAGLGAAVEALAERASVPVEVDVPGRRYDGPVEATAYFVVAEALTNVARHARATQASVVVVEGGDRITLSVTDDGLGGADPAAGSGLRGLADRLAAVGGRLTVSSRPGGGTRVEAELPTTLRPAEATVVAPPIPTDRSPGLGVVGGAVAQTPRMARPEPRVGVALGVGLVAVLTVVVVAAVSVAPRAPAAPVAHRDDAFALPFDYLLPADTSLTLSAKSTRLHVLERPTGDRPEGISIWIVGAVLVDPCRPDGPTAAVPSGPDGLLRHLGGVPGLALSQPASVTVDGRPATRLDATVAAGERVCTFVELGLEGMSLWRDDTSPTKDWILVPRDRRVPLTILEVGGETVVIEIWSYRDLEAWLPVANGVVESIRFHHAADGAVRRRELAAG